VAMRECGGEVLSRRRKEKIDSSPPSGCRQRAFAQKRREEKRSSPPQKKREEGLATTRRKKKEKELVFRLGRAIKNLFSRGDRRGRKKEKRGSLPAKKGRRTCPIKVSGKGKGTTTFYSSYSNREERGHISTQQLIRIKRDGGKGRKVLSCGVEGGMRRGESLFHVPESQAFSLIR